MCYNKGVVTKTMVLRSNKGKASWPYNQAIWLDNISVQSGAASHTAAANNHPL